MASPVLENARKFNHAMSKNVQVCDPAQMNIQSLKKRLLVQGMMQLRISIIVCQTIIHHVFTENAKMSIFREMHYS